ncbi:MAG: HEAT repeat domain-containing protein, partial [Planctomycetes bacterium]|nr:HEAT repeat domain-containing protein [Planctomycetota bacterium]
NTKTDATAKTESDRRSSTGSILFAALSLTMLGGVIVLRNRKRAIVVMLAAGVVLSGVTASLVTAGQKKKSTEKPAAKPPTILQLIDQLKDPKKASAASQALIKHGEKAIPDLIGEAIEGSDLAMRGWAIVCLAEIGGKRASERLLEMQNDKKQPPLVRTWAAAGRVHMAESTNELLQLANLIPQFPALGRPIGMKLVAKLTAKGNKATAEDLLAVTIRVRQLQAPLAPAILATGADSLAKAMRSSKNQQIRRQAAAYLATLANKGEDAVPGAIVKAYAFDPQAKSVPWNGGPLFIPLLQWQQKKDDAKRLVGNLIAWYVWCEENTQGATRTALQRQLHNNLRSLQLAAAAGYRSPGFRQAGTNAWLQTWGAAAGKAEIARILKAQNLTQNPRYQQILNGLK